MRKITDSITNEVIYNKKHKSGLDIYIMPRKDFKKSYAIFATKYGSIDSEFIVPGEDKVTKVPDGIAHYLEHKMFDMPGDVNIFEQFAKYGANANAFTSFDTTAYLFSATNNFEDNLKTLLDYVQTPYFTPESVQKEQGIIAQEINMYRDNAAWAVFSEFLNCIYHNHPIKREIAGTVESIAEIDSDLLYKCYNTFYNLSNMKIFVTGDFEPQKILEIIEGGIKNNEPFEEEIQCIYHDEPKEIVKNYAEKTLSISQPQFMMGFKETDVGYNGRALLKRHMIAEILLDMLFSESAPLYNKMLDMGIINDTFGVDYSLKTTYGYTTIEGESECPEKVRDVIFEEIARLKKVGLEEDAFIRLKKSMWGEYIRLFDTISGFAHSFITLKMVDIDYVEDYFEVYKTLTFDDVQQWFEKHFDEKYFAMAVIKPSV